MAVTFLPLKIRVIIVHDKKIAAKESKMATIL
jgi:hypothetical protein